MFRPLPRKVMRDAHRAAGLVIRAVAISPRSFLHDVARLPLERQAAARIGAVPTVELVELTRHASDFVVRLPARDTRHTWSLGAAEQICLIALISARQCRTAFEIGTFNGGTTRLLAEALPEDGSVRTIDLPSRAFDAAQHPSGFTGSDVGAAYRMSPAVDKITQLRGDSLQYDFRQFEQSADIVLVDGGHEYENGLVDTRTALRLVRPGGIVVWDDFEPYWHGLVNGICDAMEGRALRRLAGTAFAVYCDERSATEPAR